MDPWGIDEPPPTEGWALPALTGRLATLAELDGWCRLDEHADPALRAAVEAGSVQAEELPEVQALAEQGWRPLGDQPANTPLPAVWPRAHRGWVPDRLPRFAQAVPQPGTPWVYRQGETEQDEAAESAELLARECGLDPPPRGRLWLVRSPWPSLGVTVLLHLIVLRGTELVGPTGGARERHAGADILTWTEQQVWDWWAQHPTDLPSILPTALPAARAWAATGAHGEDVADLVLAGLDPDALALLRGDVADGGAGLSRAQALAWTRLAGDAGRTRYSVPDPPGTRGVDATRNRST